MLLSYVFEDLLQVVDACLRVMVEGMLMIMTGSFLSYRDAIQLHGNYLIFAVAVMLE